jgi:hypothetical protein
MIKNVIVTLIVMILTFNACVPVTSTVTPIPTTALVDINRDPNGFVGKTLSIEGVMMKQLGVTSKLEYVLNSSLKLELTQVKVGVFEFGNGENSVVVKVQTQGNFVPLVAPEPKLPSGHVVLTGTWVKGNAGEYYFSMFESNP